MGGLSVYTLYFYSFC